MGSHRRFVYKSHHENLANPQLHYPHLSLSLSQSAPARFLQAYPHRRSLSSAGGKESNSERIETMEMQQYYARKWNSISDAEAADSDDTSCKDGFDCNICLEFANEPVVTLCGHLYCWPCIYKWLRVQSASDHSDECPQCPVCKTEISHATMVPLYGRGSEKTELKGKAPSRGIIVPPRPSGWDAQALVSSSPRNSPQLSYRSPYQNQQYRSYPYNGYEEHSSSPLVSLSGSPHPMAGQIGEMFYARVFGNSESLYAYPNSYHLTGSSSPRIRRHEMQAEKSLNRICIFLFCCLLLCLIVF